MTYREISKKYNITITTLTRRVNVLRLKGRFVNREKFFDESQVKQMVEYDTKAHLKRRPDTKNLPRKLKIIEFYLKLKSARRVSEFLNLSRPIVTHAVKEYNETGFVTVGSKMNDENFNCN